MSDYLNLELIERGERQSTVCTSSLASVSCPDKDRNSPLCVSLHSCVTSCVGEVMMLLSVDWGRSMYGSAFGRKSCQYCGRHKVPSYRWLASSLWHHLPWHFLSRFHCTFVKAFFSTSPISPLLLLPVPLILLCLLSSSCFSLLFPQCRWALPRSFPQQGWPTCCMATVLTNLPHQPDWLHQIMSFSQPNLLQSSHSHCM